MTETGPSAALRAARLAAGLPAVAERPVHPLRRAKSDRQERPQSSDPEMSAAYRNLQNRMVLKRSVTVSNIHARKSLAGDSLVTRTWTPPPPPYSTRERSSTTSSGPSFQDFAGDGRARRMIPPPLQHRLSSSTATSGTTSSRLNALRMLDSENTHIGTSTTTLSTTTDSIPASFRSNNTSVAWSAAESRPSIASASSSSYRTYNITDYAPPARAVSTPISLSELQSSERPMTAPSSGTSETPTTPPPSSLARRFSRRRSTSSRNSGIYTPPELKESTSGPMTPERLLIQPPSLPSPELLASLERRLSQSYATQPDRNFSPVLTRSRSNSAPRAAAGARRYPQFPPSWEVHGGVRGSIYEEDETPYNVIPPVPPLPVELPAPVPLQQRSRAPTANTGRRRPQSAVIVNGTGMQDWRRRELSTPAIVPISSQMLAAKLAFPAPQQQGSSRSLHSNNTPSDEQMEDFRAMRDVGRRHVSLPPPPRQQQQTPSTMYIGNDVHVDDRVVDDFRDRRNIDTQVKQTRFIGNEQSRDNSPASVIVPDVAKTVAIGQGEGADVNTEKKSRRKSFMLKLKKLFE